MTQVGSRKVVYFIEFRLTGRFLNLDKQFKNDKYNSKIHSKFRMIIDSEEILEEPHQFNLLPKLRNINFLLSSSRSVTITVLS